MEMKQVINIEIEKKGFIYSFSMPVNSPVGLAYDVLFEMLSGVMEIAKQQIERAKPEVNSKGDNNGSV